MNVSITRASFALAFCACSSVGASINFDAMQTVFALAGSPSLWQAVVGDIDGDVDQDLVTILSQPDPVTGRFMSTVQVLRNDGGLVFTPTASFAAGGDAGGLALADLDGNGTLDLALLVQSFVASAWVRELVIADGDGAGGFAALERTTVNTGSTQLFVRDLDLDGDPDLALFAWRFGPGSGQTTQTLVTYMNQGGAFSSGQSIDLPPNLRLLALARVDADGYPDALVGPGSDGWSGILFEAARMLRNGATGFATVPETVATLPLAMDKAAEVDLDGSGALELVTLAYDPDQEIDGEDVDCTLRIHRRAASGGIASATALATRAVPCGPAPLTTQDLDGDGSAEIAYLCWGWFGDPGYVNFLSVGPGDVLMPSPRVAGDGFRAVADLDGDARLDLLLATGQELVVRTWDAAPNRLPLMPPTLSYTIGANGHVVGSFATTDPDGNPLSYDVVDHPNAPNYSLAMAFPAATFDYYWDSGVPSGTDSFTVRISDHSGTTVDAVIQLNLQMSGGGGGAASGGGGSLDLLTLALLFACAIGMARRGRRPSLRAD